jgi:hypothetical protein
MHITGLSDVSSPGEAAYFALAPHPSLVAALNSFGLKETPDALHAVAPSEAEEILSHLLAKGMAYGEDHTFDSGIVVDNGSGEYACIWFTDED